MNLIGLYEYLEETNIDDEISNADITNKEQMSTTAMRIQFLRTYFSNNGWRKIGTCFLVINFYPSDEEEYESIFHICLHTSSGAELTIRIGDKEIEEEVRELDFLKLITFELNLSNKERDSKSQVGKI